MEQLGNTLSVSADSVSAGGGADISLDKLVALVEKAARVVDYLQKENAMLADDVKDYQTALQSAAMKAAMQASRIQSLEIEAESLRQDAQWWRWFHDRYHNSTFFSHIEREFEADQVRKAADGDGNGDALAA